MKQNKSKEIDCHLSIHHSTAFLISTPKGFEWTTGVWRSVKDCMNGKSPIESNDNVKILYDKFGNKGFIYGPTLVKKK